MYLYLDIETLPAIGMSPEDRAALVRDKVPASYKKPESIEAWIAENAEEAWRRTALDSMRGELLCIGAALDDREPVVFYPEPGEPEAGVLVRFSAWCAATGILTRRPIVVGHNILGFDLPWLWRRAVRYGLRGLASYLPHERYTKMAVDTMEAWNGTLRQGYTHLDEIARYLGIPGKGDVDGSKVYDLWAAGEHDKIATYCAADVELVRAVHRRIAGEATLTVEVE